MYLNKVLEENVGTVPSIAKQKRFFDVQPLVDKTLLEIALM